MKNCIQCNAEVTDARVYFGVVGPFCNVECRTRHLCVHRNIHPGRFDGARTVCIDCRSVVSVTSGAGGVSFAEGCERATRDMVERGEVG